MNYPLSACPPKNKAGTIPAILFLILVALTACGPQIIKSRPAKRAIAPPRSIPGQAGLPATQRPYRINGKTYFPLPSAQGYTETGIASWYGSDFHGRKTSNGETYDMHGMTAAHKTLPMNTYLLVQNLLNQKELVVRVNDRGPFVKGRIIDLSKTAARKLDMITNGTAKVRITALGEAVRYRQGNRYTERFLPHQDFEHGNFYVQIGSFTDKANADRLKDKMIAWGKETTTSKYTSSGRIFYRVQVRGGKSLTEARRTERVLTEAGFSDAFVVAR